MRVSVVPIDKAITVDGIGAILTEWPFNDSDIHAIQWYGTEGEIEYPYQLPSKAPRRANEAITDEATVQPYVAAHKAFLIAQQAEREKAKAEGEAANKAG
jgi:hypothetical protein